MHQCHFELSVAVDHFRHEEIQLKYLSSQRIDLKNLKSVELIEEEAEKYQPLLYQQTEEAFNVQLPEKHTNEMAYVKERPVRFIVDDCIKFVQREKRQGRQYEGIIMDPPSFGRGPGGEVWKLETELYRLVEACALILAPKPLFFLINSYTTGLQPGVIQNILELAVASKYGGSVSASEIGLPVTASKIILPCGACGRWEFKA